MKRDSAGQEIVVQISDNGSGVDMDLIPRLSEKFASSQTLGGAGLGLYISEAIIEAHGGRIWAENNPEDKGATFTFVLPIGEPREATSSEANTRPLAVMKISETGLQLGE